MIICICRRVSDRDIQRAALQGCASFEQLQDELRVATCCGLCRDCARDTFAEHADAAARQVAWTPAHPVGVASEQQSLVPAAG